MGTIRLVTRGRIFRDWRTLVVAGLLLGVGFGLSLASFAAARRTASSYDRILGATDAPDASVALGRDPERGEQALRSIDGITRQRIYASFTATADGLDPILTAAIAAPTHDRFPAELPVLRAGRLPDPGAPDEILVNADAARRGGVHVGQRLHFHFLAPGSTATNDVDLTVVGIGTFPAEPVKDETLVVGGVVLTRAFYDAHPDLATSFASNVDLEAGLDARRDLAPKVGAVGYELLSARSQERAAVNEALRPVILVLAAFGVLAFGAAALFATQVIQRSRDRWFDDSTTLRTIGMDRIQIRGLEFALTAVMAILAVGVALITMLLLAPLGPVGPLHALDPPRGFSVDGTVAALGTFAVLALLAVLTLVFSAVRRRPKRRVSKRAPRFVSYVPGPAATAGLTVALSSGDARATGWRAVVTTTAAAVMLALVATFVASAIALSDDPARYGFDADLLALNAYGDQSPAALRDAFHDRDDVAAATGFTVGSFLVDGRAVPGIAATSLKGELVPTILRGRPPRGAREIVVGQDTLDDLDAGLGAAVPVQLVIAANTDVEPAGDPVRLTIVGVATFPAVNQLGTDLPRLGTGALLTRAAYLQLNGPPENDPEFTAVRIVDGANTDAIIERNRRGFLDDVGSTTEWFIDAKPAELIQLDAAMRYLRAALLVAYAIVITAIVHALWVRARDNRHDLAVLRALGCARRQLDAVTAWQALPFALAALVIGVPLGTLLGRRVFTAFAHSLGVVDRASTPLAVVLGLVVAVALATVVGVLVAVATGRRVGAASVPREG